ncbi:uncharacterized protein (DUF1697 family) [Desulfohalotomaculum tongense]|uniref:hypothetical protein n=1 Tax=Desulforadius tongensis TaxID=1216062 RepID=UPI0019571482|nr:hypothetical protein [Desulforadius tongensis]MBM7854472.1 uncharacterized protein (DUF1697 family) [Desulforadius tongensis]
MEWHGLRVKIIIAAFIGGLVLFFGGHFLYHKYNVEQPLKDDIVKNNSAVQDLVIEKDAGVVHITVDVKKGNFDIMALYKNISQKAKMVLDGQPFVIEFKDNPDAHLEDIWRQSQYVVHQAIMQGNFPEMVAVIERIAGQHKVKAKVYVDHDNVYIQLVKEDGHNLLKVVSRQNFMVTGKIARAGGDAGVKGN